MNLTEQQQLELKDAVRPLLKWINDNCHPHVKVIVDSNSAEVVEGVTLVKNDEYIKD